MIRSRVERLPEQTVCFPARLDIPQPTAQTKASTVSPVFYFYFETDNREVGDFGTSATAAAQSPTEFTLVHLKEKKGEREMVVGKANLFGAKLGIDSKEAVQFLTDELRDGIVKVHPSTPLEPGEYAFVLRAGSDAYRIYDFEVG